MTLVYLAITVNLGAVVKRRQTVKAIVIYPFIILFRSTRSNKSKSRIKQNGYTK